MYVEAVSSAPGRRKRADMDLSVACSPHRRRRPPHLQGDAFIIDLRLTVTRTQESNLAPLFW
jgi:hypothetical protein